MAQQKALTQEAITATFPRKGIVGYDEHNARVEDAMAPVVDAPLPAPVVDEKPAYITEVLPAAARTSNAGYGAYHTALEAEHHDIDLNYKYSEHKDELRKDVPSEYWDRLVDFRSLGAAQEKRKQIIQEVADNQLLQKGGLAATATQFGLMVADYPTLLGGYGEAYALGNMLTKGARLKNFITAGKIGAGAAMFQEEALQLNTHTRGIEDTIYAGVFGSTVGGALGAFSKQGKDLSKEIMLSMDRKLAAETPMRYATPVELHAVASAEEVPKFPLLNKKQKVQRLDERVAELKAENTALVDKHTVDRKLAEERVAYEDRPVNSTNSLGVSDDDLYDELDKTYAEFVNGIKGSYKKIVQNDGSTSAMFIPWENSAKRPGLSGQYSDLTDKKAKVEISDRDSKLVPDFESKLKVHGYGTAKDPIRHTGVLSDVMEHPTLYDAYPAARDIEIEFTHTRENSAVYHPGLNLISISRDFINKPDKARELILHEMQHAVQTQSGFARGSSMRGAGEDAWNRYHFSAGEEEARRTAKRVNLMDEARLGSPYQGSDVAQLEDLIVDTHKVGKSSADLRGATMAAHEVLDASGNVVPTARDIMQDAVALEATGVFKNLTETKTGKVLMKLGFTDSSWLLSQKSPIAKLISYELLENGAGIAGRTSTAAIQKFTHLKTMLSMFMPDLTASYKQFAHENNISHWNLKQYYGEGMERWNKELRTEMELRRNAFRDGVEHASPHKQYIQDAADSLQRVADHSLSIAIAKGVRGFEDIVKQAGYVPLIWSGRALRKLGNGDAALNKIEVAAHEALLSKGYASALGITLEDAQKFAKAVVRRALHKDLGIDANPRSLFSGDSRGFLRQALEESDTGLSTKSIDELFARIDARQGDKGMSSRAKRRTDIDLLVQDAEGRSLLNIVDNDVPMLYNRYASEMSGRAALASKGITSEADWTRLREKAVLAASAHGDDVEKLKTILDTTYNQMLGRPAGGGVNKNARRLMDMATVASLGQVGFAQMAEFAPIIAAHGIGGMFEVLPAVKAYRAALKNGTLGKDVLSELHPTFGRIGEEEMLFRPDIRLDDKLSDDPAWLRILDKGLGTLNDVSGKLSMMHQIKTVQQQFVVMMQANKVAKAVQKGDWGKLKARFADLGWDDAFMSDLKDVSKHFEFDESGTLQRLNLQEWRNPELTEKFLHGLHRHTNQMIQMQMIGETAYWMHPTIGAMLTQFRTFPLVAMEKQTARHMLMADEEAMFTATYGLGLSALVYTAKVGFNALGKGNDKQQYLNDRLSIEAISKGALQYANIAGPIQDVSNLAVAAGLAPKIMSSSNVGRTGGSKQANLSISDIPSLGTGLKLFNAASGLAKGAVDPTYNYGKRDLQNIQGGMPLGNTPFLAIPWNIAKDHVQ